MRTPISNGYEFVSYQSQPTDEVHGWLEKDHQVVKGTGGWWRTTDPAEAARIADSLVRLGSFPPKTAPPAGESNQEKL